MHTNIIKILLKIIKYIYLIKIIPLIKFEFQKINKIYYESLKIIGNVTMINI
jgi:hypothetical protein